MTDDRATVPLQPPFECEGVPERALRIYARLWQFETWLRNMVYVELRALRADDWSSAFRLNKSSFEADKYLRHMPTPEMNALSYSQLRDLTELVKGDWACFEPYLPPHDLWSAKLREVSQIRHRMAHFRVGHVDDYARVRQFLRDLDSGFWTFCTSYNAPRPILPQSDDPVTAHFLSLDPLPWGELESRQWARVGMVDHSLVVGVTVEVLTRGWATRTHEVDGVAGHLYDVRLIALDHRHFDYAKLLEASERVHSHLAHACLQTMEGSLRVTLPSVLGHKKVISVVEELLEAARYNVNRSRRPIARDPDAVADEWPEYVLGPKNPLTFLEPAMPCSFFGV